MKYLILTINFTFFIISFSFSQNINQPNPKFLNEIESIKNKNLICLVFEDHFVNDSLFIENKENKIINTLFLKTDDRLGLAERIWLSKNEFPLKISFNQKQTLVSNTHYKYIYIGKIKPDRFKIQFSKERRIYR